MSWCCACCMHRPCCWRACCASPWFRTYLNTRNLQDFLKVFLGQILFALRIDSANGSHGFVGSTDVLFRDSLLGHEIENIAGHDEKVLFVDWEYFCNARFTFAYFMKPRGLAFGLRLLRSRARLPCYTYQQMARKCPPIYTQSRVQSYDETKRSRSIMQ